jgi:hypothetical protein
MAALERGREEDKNKFEKLEKEMKEDRKKIEKL